MKLGFGRLLSGLAFALPLALATFAMVRADSTPTVSTQETSFDCTECHGAIQQAWEAGAHGQALKDSVFQADWEAKGKPQECLACHTTGYDPATGTYIAEGVTCAACHNPIGSGHPLSPATMSRSADMCGACHRETVFEWQSSRHGASDLTCVSCHDAHATDIRAADTSTLCASCHGTRVAAYGHSAHAAQGLTCTDCHIGEATDGLGMGQGAHNHSFSVDLSKCTKCHEAELHSPAKAMLVSAVMPTPPPDAGSSGTTREVAATPEPVSPLGYALFAGLIGLAGGIILAPWLERGIHLVVRREQQGEEVQS